MLAPAFAGFVTGGSLIVAIGAQNAFVLRQGLLRHHVLPVVAVCALSDIALIAAGVGGLGVLLQEAGPALAVIRWLGVAFLVWYAAGALRRALRTQSLAVGAAADPRPRGAVVGEAAALTWFNPHVYLDTVLLIGSIASGWAGATTAGVSGHWLFGLGAMVASVVWFSLLGFGARSLRPVFASPRAWRVFEVLVALTMLLVAAKLARG